jgi:hypothetical protein
MKTLTHPIFRNGVNLYIDLAEVSDLHEEQNGSRGTPTTASAVRDVGKGASELSELAFEGGFAVDL